MGTKNAMIQVTKWLDTKRSQVHLRDRDMNNLSWLEIEKERIEKELKINCEIRTYGKLAALFREEGQDESLEGNVMTQEKTNGNHF